MLDIVRCYGLLRDNIGVGRDGLPTLRLPRGARNGGIFYHPSPVPDPPSDKSPNNGTAGKHAARADANAYP